MRLKKGPRMTKVSIGTDPRGRLSYFSCQIKNAPKDGTLAIQIGNNTLGWHVLAGFPSNINPRGNHNIMATQVMCQTFTTRINSSLCVRLVHKVGLEATVIVVHPTVATGGWRLLWRLRPKNWGSSPHW
jgi:hypothetical protein